MGEIPPQNPREVETKLPVEARVDVAFEAYAAEAYASTQREGRAQYPQFVETTLQDMRRDHESADFSRKVELLTSNLRCWFPDSQGTYRKKFESEGNSLQEGLPSLSEETIARRRKMIREIDRTLAEHGYDAAAIEEIFAAPEGDRVRRRQRDEIVAEVYFALLALSDEDLSEAFLRT